MEEDKELELIRLKKLREMIKQGDSNKEGNELTSKKPVELMDSTFNEMIQKYPLVVVDCWAPWCAPCQMIAPVIEEMAQEYAGKIFFCKLNIDMNQRVAKQYQIMSIPTLLVFKNGKLVDRIIGAMPRQMLEHKITRYL